MSFWTAMVVMVAIIAFACIRMEKHKAQGRIDGSASDDANPLHSALPAQRETELQSEVEGLRERIKVLERIATDEHKPQRLAAEIESLRDQ